MIAIAIANRSSIVGGQMTIGREAHNVRGGSKTGSASRGLQVVFVVDYR